MLSVSYMSKPYSFSMIIVAIHDGASSLVKIIALRTLQGDLKQVIINAFLTHRLHAVEITYELLKGLFYIELTVF